jgi:hypothetical protein
MDCAQVRQLAYFARALRTLASRAFDMATTLGWLSSKRAAENALRRTFNHAGLRAWRIVITKAAWLSRETEDGLAYHG